MSTINCFLIGCFLILCANNLSAQSQDDSIERYMPTENLNAKKESNKRRNKSDNKNYSYIYKKNTEGILYGNPCALEETHKMGFEYIVEKQSLPGSLVEEDAKWNNFLVNVKLIFTRSPFWKLILNKRIKECRYKTGDIVG